MKRYVDSIEQLVTEIVVTDIRHSTEFYLRLGFELLRDGGDFVELTWEDHRLYLAELSAFRDARGAASIARPPFPLANIRVMVFDVDECWNRANELGARIVIPLADRYYGLRDFTIADPDGFGIRFASLLPEGSALRLRRVGGPNAPNVVATQSVTSEKPDESQMTTTMRDPRTSRPIAVPAEAAPPRTKPSHYPEPFFSRMAGREKRPLGDLFGLENFGVNLTKLAPGGESALLHRHSAQDEFVFVLRGEPTLVTDIGEATLSPGMCAGFPAQGIAHQLVNRTSEDVVFLEIGDRTKGDEGTYPHDDLRAALGSDGTWVFSHKDGTPY